MKTKFLLFVILFSFTFFIGCTNDDSKDTSPTSSTIKTEDIAINSEIDTSIDDISVIAEDQYSLQQNTTAKIDGTERNFLPSCATITVVLTNETYTKTIDFGTEGCTLPNGNIVKGKIIISFSKNFTTPSITISYTLIGFYHNGKLIEGNKTITHELKSTDLLATPHPVATHSVDVKITFPDGTVYSRIGTRVREMVEGFQTFNWEDNVFLVSGNNTTTFPNGDKYAFTITTPLRIAMSCRMSFPVSGIIEIEKNDEKATLDYGNDDCDKLATITINGVVEQISLRK